MVSVSYIEDICKKMKLEDLPALNQLRKAFDEKRDDDVKRIATNILMFLGSQRSSSDNH